jgi:hypothetical protein
MNNRFLTETGLYRLDKPLPQTSEEYINIIEEITGESGVFPGDIKPVFGNSYLNDTFLKSSTPFSSPKQFMIKSGGSTLNVERFSPSINAPEKMNRIIFDFDLICQCAIFNTLGSRGSYDRIQVYSRRFFQADIVFIIRNGALPIGLLTITHHFIKLDVNNIQLTKVGREKLSIHEGFVKVPYFWIHGGLFAIARHGIANTIVFQFFIEEFQRIRHEYMPVIDLHTKQIDVQKGLIYILGHSDKVPPFHIFKAYFRPIREGIIRDLIFQKAFEFITPEEERSSTFFDLEKGVDKSSADPLNSYKRDNQGRAIIPEQEQQLSSYKEFTEILGESIGDNAIYFLGVFDEGVLLHFHQRLIKRGVNLENIQ